LWVAAFVLMISYFMVARFGRKLAAPAAAVIRLVIAVAVMVIEAVLTFYQPWSIIPALVWAVVTGLSIGAYLNVRGVA
jgi:hypothetical protein